MRKIAVLIGIVIIVVVAFFVVRHGVVKTKKPAALATKATVVTVAPLRYHTVPKTVMAYGSTLAPNTVVLKAQTNGVVKAMTFHAGQSVKQGQSLLTLSSNDIDNQLEKLKAQLTSSKSAYERQLTQSKNLPGSVAALTLLQSKSQYQENLAAYQKAYHVSHVVAPVAGRLSDSALAVGSYVAEGDVIVHIINKTPLQVRYTLSSQYFPQVAVGQKVLFKPAGMHKTYQATVSYKAPLLNAGDHGMTVRANLIKAAALPTNLFGQVTQVLNPKYRVLALPQSLVQTDAKGFYAYTVDHGKVAKRYFTPGNVSTDGLIAIKKGIAAKTPIIVSNITALSPGQKVTVMVGS